MRVLHISKYYSPCIGGVENICKYIVDGQPKDSVAVVCFDEGRRDCVDFVNGVKVWRVGTWINISRQALSLSYFRVLYRAIQEFKPDIIQFHWANPFPAAVLLTMLPKNIKLIIHWHMDIINQKRIYPLIKPIETALLKRANLVVVTSPQYRDGSIPLLSFRSKIRIVQNAINEDMMKLRPDDEFRIKELKSKYDNKKIIFFVGRHISYKGLPYLLEAEKYIKEECVLIIAGSGPLTDSLKSQCKSSRVHFVGRLSDDELRWYHYAATIFAFPSITKNEAFGVALAEAMYASTPAVTFHIEGSGVNWVCLDQLTGFEVPNGDCRAYANAIDRLLADEELATRMGHAGHKRVVENFTIPLMNASMNQCYNEIMRV